MDQDFQQKKSVFKANNTTLYSAAYRYNELMQKFQEPTDGGIVIKQAKDISLKYISLYVAVKENKNDVVVKLLNKGVDAHPNKDNPYLCGCVTPLQAAIENNNKKLVGLLVDKTNLLLANLSSRLLESAWKHKDHEVFELLLKKVVEAELKNEKKESIRLYQFLHEALANKQEEKAQIITNILCESTHYYNSVLDQECFEESLANDHETIALQLLKNREGLGEACGIWKDAIESLNKDTHNNRKKIEFFIKHNIGINSTDGNGYTPLLYAAQSGNIALMKRLVDVGADDTIRVYDTHNKDMTPYSYAFLMFLYNRYTEPSSDDISFLMDKDKNYKNLQYWARERKCTISILYPAIKLKYNSMVKLLLEHGFDANRIELSHTPLHIAAFANNIECMRYLVNAKANVNARKKEDDFSDANCTPLYASINEGSCEAVRFLIDNKADLDIKSCTVNSHSEEPLETPYEYAKNALKWNKDQEIILSRDASSVLFFCFKYRSPQRVKLLKTILTYLDTQPKYTDKVLSTAIPEKISAYIQDGLVFPNIFLKIKRKRGCNIITEYLTEYELALVQLLKSSDKKYDKDVEFLLENNIKDRNLNEVRSWEYKSLLSLALEFDRLEVAKLLITKGNLSAKHEVLYFPFSDYHPPLYYVAKSSSKDEKLLEEITALLINNGARVDHLTNNYKRYNYTKTSPLHIAALRGNYTMVKILIDHKADFNLRCYNNSWHTNHTPRELAQVNGHKKIVDLLRSAEEKNK